MTPDVPPQYATDAATRWDYLAGYDQAMRGVPYKYAGAAYAAGYWAAYTAKKREAEERAQARKAAKAGKA